MATVRPRKSYPSKTLTNGSRGSNFPPEPVPINGREELRARLEREYSKMAERCLELEVGLTQLPVEISNQDEAQRVTDFLAKQVGPFIRGVEAAHKREKAPVLELAREYDEFFLGRMTKKLKQAISVVQSRMAHYQTKLREAARRAQLLEKQRADAERLKAEQEAERARQAAEKIAANDREKAKEFLRKAKEAEAQAAAAKMVIDAPPDKGHIRGDHGSVGYLRDEWEFECVDPFEFAQGLLDGTVPWKYFQLNERAIRDDIIAAAKQARINNTTPPGIEIRGVEIFQTSKFVAKG